MKGSELQFDCSCHVLYTAPCKKQIQKKTALCYPAADSFLAQQIKRP